MVEKIPLRGDEPLEPGDLVELHFKSIGGTWIKAAQIAIIEYRLRDREGFRIRNWSIPDKTTVVFTVEVKKTNPVVVTCLAIATVILAATGFVGFSAHAFYKIAEVPKEILADPIGKVVAVGGTASIILFVIYLMMRQK